MIEKCPICGGNELYLYAEFGFHIGENEEMTVFCNKCGEIGVVDLVIHAKRGTFKLFEDENE